jgi:ABC-type nitrate/sulfonate/bicarbonate transport system permease component
VAGVPFAILLIGLNNAGILFVVIMSSVFSVIISTYSGIQNIPPLYVRAAKNMGAKGISLFRFVMIPAATPSMLVGIKQAWSFAWHALIGRNTHSCRCRSRTHIIGRQGISTHGSSYRFNDYYIRHRSIIR